MTKDEALKLALASLQGLISKTSGQAIYSFMETERRIAMSACVGIKEALAQQQEPVAWLWELTGEVTTDPDRADGMWLPLYTSTPTSKPWVGLTEQEHTDIAVECGCISADWVFYGATVERKLKGKNS